MEQTNRMLWPVHDIERQYLNLMDDAIQRGVWKGNRTGVRTVGGFGAMLTHDMRLGFPLLTTKRVNFDAVAAELAGFIHAADSAAVFRGWGTKIWDANANMNASWLANPARRGTDDLGRIYGVQWRRWRSIKVEADSARCDQLRSLGYNEIGIMSKALCQIFAKEIDQLQLAVDKLRHNPEDRRIIVSAWNPGDLDEVALPPCHLKFQLWVNPDMHTVSLNVNIRSWDLFLGAPFNIASYALLLSFLAHITGHEPGYLKVFADDYHVYENHLEQVAEQLKRPVIHQFPRLRLNPEMRVLDDFRPSSVELIGYESHPSIKGDMAV